MSLPPPGACQGPGATGAPGVLVCGAVPRHPELGLRPPLPPGSAVLSPAPGNQP